MTKCSDLALPHSIIMDSKRQCVVPKDIKDSEFDAVV
jgi:hypothetical protein